jgi:hypothetical protein
LSLDTCAIGLATLQFGNWIAAPVLLKQLVRSAIRRHVSPGVLIRLFRAPLTGERDLHATEAAALRVKGE